MDHTNLGDNLENLTLEGNNFNVLRRFFGNGNNLDNVIRGTDQATRNELFGSGGNDTLIGAGGQDMLEGGTGDDLLQGSRGDFSSMSGNEGNDTLVGRSSHRDDMAGGDGDDRLIGGDGDDFLRGDDFFLGHTGNDTLIGGNDNDLLQGESGNDLLTGSSGSDQFLFGRLSTGPTFGSASVDTITDFTVGIDKFLLSKIQFTALQSSGDLLASEFEVVNSDSQVGVSNAKIVYNLANGKVFYNSDGAIGGFGAGGQFATLNGAPANLSNTDFSIEDF